MAVVVRGMSGDGAALVAWGRDGATIGVGEDRPFDLDRSYLGVFIVYNFAYGSPLYRHGWHCMSVVCALSNISWCVWYGYVIWHNNVRIVLYVLLCSTRKRYPNEPGLVK